MNTITAYLPRPSLVVGAFLLTSVSQAWGHCDTLDGPVIQNARVALESGDVTPALKWVPSEAEAEIRDAFQKTMVVRKTSTPARELADRFFFETLVRVHRAGEGAPYTGLKPADTVDDALVLADQALGTGSPDELVSRLTQAVEHGIRSRYAKAVHKKMNSAHSVEAGREYVEAYIEYVHFVEAIHRQLARVGHDHAPAGGGKHEGHERRGYDRESEPRSAARSKVLPAKWPYVTDMTNRR